MLSQTASEYEDHDPELWQFLRQVQRLGDAGFQATLPGSWSGSPSVRKFYRHRVAGAGEVRMEHDCPTHDVAIRLIFDTLTDEGHGVVRDLSEIDSVAHRVVHGGDRYTHSVLIDDDVIRAIEDFAVLAPLHNPKNLIGIRYAMAEMREIPHTASWDTAFSAAFMPLHTSVYAIPYEYYSDYGVRRYGYQGLSHLYVAKRAAALMAKKSSEVNLVSLHSETAPLPPRSRTGSPSIRAWASPPAVRDW